MKNFSQLITEPDVNQRADTKEVVGLFLTAMVLSYACGPLFGDNKGGGMSFWGFLADRMDKRHARKEQEKQEKEKKEQEKEKKGLELKNN